MMRWIHRVCACGFLAGSAAFAQAIPPEVDAALQRANVPRNAVTLYVAPVAAAGAPRLTHRIDEPVNPASVAKLVTTFAALELLGPAFAWQTPVYIEGTLQGGTLQGNVYIRGTGDPKLVVERLWLMLRRLQALGVKRIAGDIVVDRSAFNIPPLDPAAFDNQPLRPQNVQPDALLINYKSVLLTFTPEAGLARVTVEPPLAGVQWPAAVPLMAGDCSDWRTGLKADFSDPLNPKFLGGYPASCNEQAWPVAFADPATYAVRAVAGMWAAIGGEVTGVAREGRVPQGLRPVFSWPSVPLPEAIRDINKFSNNVMAQQLFLTLGLQVRGSGSFTASREVVRSWWQERFGGDPPVVDNGSGLSRSERITARQLGQLLQAAWASPHMPELMASLPAAGLDGTLRRRRTNVGLAHLKTGSLANVSGVAGYVHGPAGRRYVLVAIANHANALAARPAWDLLVEWAARE